MSESSFARLGVPAPLTAVLSAEGIESPFPIQADTLPDTLAGRDVLGRGKTGSGKTLAFSLPLVARLGTKLAGGRRKPGRPLGLVLAPTRELATQIAAVITPLAAAYGLKSTTIFGGVSQNPQISALRNGVDIVVACPGRLEDLMQQGALSLDAIEITVIDEADHMADLGFLPVVTRILAKTPGSGQRLLFSATLDNGVDKLVNRFLHNEVLHSVDEANSPVAAMTHHVFEVSGVDAKKALVQQLASGTGRRILFMRTKHHAKKLARQLTEAGIPAVDLHGNLSQGQRDRNLAAFSSGEARVLVATDVAARGVHVDDVELVIHVDPPTEHKAYLHRSGRTARAGAEGSVVTLVLPAQRQDVAQLLRKAKISATPEQVTTKSESVIALVGEVAEYVKPAPRAVRAEQGAGRGSGGRGGSARSGQGRTKPSRSTQSRSAESRGGQSRSGQGRSARGRSGQGAAVQSASGQGRTAAYSTSTQSQPAARAQHSGGSRQGALTRHGAAGGAAASARSHRGGSRRASAAQGSPGARH